MCKNQWNDRIFKYNYSMNSGWKGLKGRGKNLEIVTNSINGFLQGSFWMQIHWQNKLIEN